MKVLEEKHELDCFPKVIECKRVKDEYGYEYAGEYCHSKLEIGQHDL